MTNKNAIMYLNMLFHDSTDEDYCATELFANAVKCGIEALEKQVPKKLEYISLEESIFECPACEGWIDYGYEMTAHKYCLICGQKLDWENRIKKGCIKIEKTRKKNL